MDGSTLTWVGIVIIIILIVFAMLALQQCYQRIDACSQRMRQCATKDWIREIVKEAMNPRTYEETTDSVRIEDLEAQS